MPRLIQRSAAWGSVVKIIIESLSSFRRRGAKVMIGKLLSFSMCLMVSSRASMRAS